MVVRAELSRLARPELTPLLELLALPLVPVPFVLAAGFLAATGAFFAAVVVDKVEVLDDVLLLASDAVSFGFCKELASCWT